MASRRRLIFKVMIWLVVISIFVWITLLSVTLTCSHYKPRRISNVKNEIRMLLRDVKRTKLYSGEKLCMYKSIGVSINYLMSNDSGRLYPNGVPKILHTTWKTNVSESDWNITFHKCVRSNSGFGFCHWLDEDLNLFVASEYPEMLENFLNYPYPVQRADVGRYLLLHKFGGFYRDMDVGCSTPIDLIYSEEVSRHSERTSSFSSLETSFKVLLIEGNPFGIAGDFMASIPGHSFFDHIIENLKHRRSTFGIPYLDVMLGTGPLFLGTSLSTFLKNSSVSDLIKDEIRIIPDDKIYDQYFYFISGNTWHCVDGTVLWWLFQHKYLVAAVIFCCFIAFKLISRLSFSFKRNVN